MKHLPNLLTLANLFCGCIAIVFILNSQPFLANFDNGEQYWVYGTQQAYLGSLFIGLAAIFDMLDGMAARALKIFSPIGKDLDSLADLVTFGVAPAMILFKMLWAAYMTGQEALDTPMLVMAPAFLLPCFSALRLARFNISSDKQTRSFIGMPVPAVGLFVASLPLILWYNIHSLRKLEGVFQNKWAIYLIIGVLCWLMVSGVRFFKLFPARWKPAYCWPQLLIAIATLIAIPFLKFAAIPFAFVLYVILSMAYKEPAVETL